MARALDAILSELNNVFNPQRDTVNQQISQLDPQQQAENQGLEAAKTDAFQQITDSANRRGLFYSGIPVGEQQRYTGATFLPAVANLKAKYAQQRFNLQDALSKITQDQYGEAYKIRQSEMNSDAAMAAARASGGSASPSFGGFGDMGTGPAPAGAGGGPTYQQRPGGGFNFQTAQGRAINAAQYAKAKGIPIRDFLQTLANAGDAGARAALGFVGVDGRADPRKITSQGQANLYYALTGNRAQVYQAPVNIRAYANLAGHNAR